MATMGRPAIYHSEKERLAAAALAAQAYRARKKALKLKRKDNSVPLTSSIIDLTSTLETVKKVISR